MTEPPPWHREMLPETADEVTFIVNAFAEAPRGEDVPLAHRGADIGVKSVGGGVDYLYAKRHLLVADQYLDQVLQILGGPGIRWLGPDEGDGDGDRDGGGGDRDGGGADPDGGGAEEPSGGRPEHGPEGKQAPAGEARGSEPQPGRDPVRLRRVIAGVVLLILPAALVDGDGGLSVPEWLDLIDGRLGRGVATPDQVLTVAPNGGASPCSATDPEPVVHGAEPWPPVCPPGIGAGTRIYLADTGLLAHAETGHPWLDGVKPGHSPHDVDTFTSGVPVASKYIGHGTFVAGITRCLAPSSELTVTNAFKVAGSTLESHLVPHLERALAGGVDIFHLTVACPSRHDLPLIAFRVWLSRLRATKGAICVCAAGNSDDSRPSWPAAFPEVIAVGALAADCRSRASFSNYGGWVDVYAPGRDIVNAYVTGEYICQVAPYKCEHRHFHGMARWSGTSFSTPIVVGLIAARMSATGENARRAADALLAQARCQAIRGVGPVLLPRCGPDAGPCGCAKPCAAQGDCGPGCRSRGCGC
jgi:Subtilase family